MKKIILYTSVALVLSCNSNKGEIASVTAELPEFQKMDNVGDVLSKPTKKPYVITSKINKLENDLYDLKIHMKLNNGSYYVSPNSKGDFKGIFSIRIDNNTELTLTSKLNENPKSVEELDSHPYVNGYINWVRENTTYTQQFQRTSDDDFKVSGTIQFTIEPNCTLEKIPFIISYRHGKMEIVIDDC